MLIRELRKSTRSATKCQSPKAGSGAVAAIVSPDTELWTTNDRFPLLSKKYQAGDRKIKAAPVPEALSHAETVKDVPWSCVRGVSLLLK
jgi:hypothetical protein